MIERSLVLMKPDAVQRGIVGEILQRFERAGLKITGAKLINADPEVVKKHYNKDVEWHKKIGGFNIKDCEAENLSVTECFGTEDPEEIGKQVNEWLFQMFEIGPVLAFVISGVASVSKIRSLVGDTYPISAAPGTIRGDFGIDTPLASLRRKRAVLNLIHASGTVEEAEEEINLWFKPEEIMDYKRTHDELYQY